MRTRWLLALLALPACAGDDGGDDTPPTEERTLATCTTSIASDVPAFYQRYFRCVTVAKTAGGVAITTEDLPPHRSSYYGATHPNYEPFDTTRGADYHANPNTIAGQAITITIPDAPVALGLPITADLIDQVANTNSAEYALGPVGVALDSVALFTGTAAPGMDIADERFTFDGYQGHPEMRGAYHYHRPTPGPLEVMADVDATVELYGVLCDGTVVLGCTELDGSAPAGLDPQGGHLGDLRDREGTTHFTARYHTHLCDDASRGHLYTPEIHYYQACPR